MVNAFAVRVVELYKHRKILNITSYTRHMITMLETSPVTFPHNKGLKTLGGVVGQDVLDVCVRKMAAWVKLTLHVL